jgi:hypothetical protein
MRPGRVERPAGPSGLVAAGLHDAPGLGVEGRERVGEADRVEGLLHQAFTVVAYLMPLETKVPVVMSSWVRVCPPMSWPPAARSWIRARVMAPASLASMAPD